MNKKRWALLAGAVILVVAAVLLTLWLFRGSSQTTLRMVQQLGNPRVVEAVRAELLNFSSLHPDVRVELATDGEADVGVLANYPADPAAWSFPLTAWSGSLWVLAAKRDSLDRLAKAEPEAVAALRAGTLEPSGFVTLLGKAKALGTPLTVGNSHLWPFMVWLQVWTAATKGPSAAQFPTAPFESVKDSMTELKRWRTQGWFDAKAWSQGWAQALAPLQEGKVFFALMNEAQLTAIAPAARGSLEFIRFPRRASDGSWNIGSAHFLAVSAKSAHPDAAAELVRYLTSPGVTTRLAQNSGRPFFSWKADANEPVVLPDWTSRANDQAFRDLAESLAK